MVRTQLKRVPWRWAAYLGLLSAGVQFAHHNAGAPLTLLVNKFIERPWLLVVILGVNNVLSMFIAPYSSWKADRIWTRWGRRKPMMIIGWSMMAIGLIIAPLVGNIYLLVLAIVLYWVAFDFGHMGVWTPLCYEVVPSPQRGRFQVIKRFIGIPLGLSYTWFMIRQFDDHYRWNLSTQAFALPTPTWSAWHFPFFSWRIPFTSWHLPLPDFNLWDMPWHWICKVGIPGARTLHFSGMYVCFFSGVIVLFVAVMALAFGLKETKPENPIPTEPKKLRQPFPWRESFAALFSHQRFATALMLALLLAPVVTLIVLLPVCLVLPLVLLLRRLRSPFIRVIADWEPIKALLHDLPRLWLFFGTLFRNRQRIMAVALALPVILFLGLVLSLPLALGLPLILFVHRLWPYFVSLFGQRQWRMIYLLIFCVACMTAGLSSLGVLLTTKQFGYRMKDLGMMSTITTILDLIIILPVAAFIVDRFNRFKIFQWGLLLSTLHPISYWLFVKFFAPNHIPTIPWIIAFGMFNAVVDGTATIALEPLIYDLIPRKMMGTVNSGFLLIRHFLGIGITYGVGFWVSGFTWTFGDVYSPVTPSHRCPDYMSGFLYVFALGVAGCVVCWYFGRELKAGRIVQYGKIEDEQELAEQAATESAEKQGEKEAAVAG